MFKNAFLDWRNALGKVTSILQMLGALFLFAVITLAFAGFILLMAIVITDSLGITHMGAVTPDRRTYQQKQMDAYELFENECVSREYTKEECLIIWNKDDD